MIKTRRFSLLELIVYVSVFTLVSTMSIMTYHAGVKNQGHLTLAGDDVSRTTRAGDAWRKRIRDADSIRLTDNVLTLENEGGNTRFVLVGDSIIRKTEGEREHILLRRVSSCRFEREKRDGFTIWTMTIELRTRSKNPAVKPLFSFISTHNDGGTSP